MINALKCVRNCIDFSPQSDIEIGSELLPNYETKQSETAHEKGYQPGGEWCHV